MTTNQAPKPGPTADWAADWADWAREDCPRLDAWVRGRKVATLERDEQGMTLRYLPGASEHDAISLTLPVREEPWRFAGRLPPCFETHRPEGANLEMTEAAYGREVVSDALKLLALTGSDAIGAVRFAPPGVSPDWKPRCVFEGNLAEADTTAFFAGASRACAGQGVAGVQPKLLVTDASGPDGEARRRLMKVDGEDWPGLSFNEYLTMRAARAAGLPVAACELSRDGRALLVDRFDDDCVVEDFCALVGHSTAQKYKGSMERLCKAADEFISEDARVMREHLLRALIVNICVGNGDAHLKNFSVLRREGSVRMTPYYDIVTIRAFPGLRNDAPALSISGKKEWLVGKAFRAFAERIGVPDARLDDVIEEVGEGVRQTMPLVADMARKHPGFNDLACEMLVIWDNGLRRIRGEKVRLDAEDRSAPKRFDLKPSEQTSARRRRYSPHRRPRRRRG